MRIINLFFPFDTTLLCNTKNANTNVTNRKYIGNNKNQITNKKNTTTQTNSDRPAKAATSVS